MKTTITHLLSLGFTLILTAGCGRVPSSWSPSESSAGVVYVRDSRKEIAEVESTHTLQLAKATVAFVANENITEDREKVILKGPRMQDQFNLCPDQRYVKQQSIANCSGVLVSPRHVLTAGHCLSAETCSQYKIIFDFRQDSPFYSPKSEEYFLPRSALYSCKKIVSRVAEIDITRPDYSLIELDRPVTGGREPVPVTDAPLTNTSDLYTLGFPSGISMKYAHGKVRFDLNINNFVAAIDTFAGNSGSPVFDEKTHALLGLVSGGEADFNYDDERGCNFVQVCKMGTCTGERIFKIGSLAKLIRTLQ